MLNSKLPLAQNLKGRIAQLGVAQLVVEARPCLDVTTCAIGHVVTVAQCQTRAQMYIGNFPKFETGIGSNGHSGTCSIGHTCSSCTRATTMPTADHGNGDVYPIYDHPTHSPSLVYASLHHVHSFGTSHRRRRRRRRVVRVRTLAPSGHLLNSMLNRPISKWPLAQLEVDTCQL